jgi:hypothetical protein
MILSSQLVAFKIQPFGRNVNIELASLGKGADEVTTAEVPELPPRTLPFVRLIFFPAGVAMTWPAAESSSEPKFTTSPLSPRTVAGPPT